MKVRYGQIAWLLAAIVVVSLGLTALCGVKPTAASEDKLSVVASFYPMYTAALRVAEGSNGVAVRCLTQPSVGCVHDHQLTPTERAVLEQADLLILNGAGAEEFLEPLLPQLSATVVNTVARGRSSDHEDHEHHEHHHNEHIWMDPAIYTVQVMAVCEALCTVDVENMALYRQNAERYVSEIEAAAVEFSAAAEALNLEKAVLFHDSMAYVAESVGLSVAGVLPIGEEQGFAAAEVAAVADAIRGQAVLFLYDDQYPLQMTQLTAYAERSAVVALNSAVRPVQGVEDKDTWLWALRNNTQKLREAAA